MPKLDVSGRERTSYRQNAAHGVWMRREPGDPLAPRETIQYRLKRDNNVSTRQRITYLLLNCQIKGQRDDEDNVGLE